MRVVSIFSILYPFRSTSDVAGAAARNPFQFYLPKPQVIGSLKKLIGHGGPDEIAESFS